MHDLNSSTIIAIEVNEKTYKRIKEESTDYSKSMNSLISILGVRLILNKNLKENYKIIYR